MIKAIGRTNKGYTVYAVNFYDVNGLAYRITVDDQSLYQGDDTPYDPSVVDAVNGKRIIWANLVRKANAIRMGGYDKTTGTIGNAFMALTGHLMQGYGQSETPPIYSVIPQTLAAQLPTTAATITVMTAAIAKNPAIFQFNNYVCVPYGGTTYCAPLNHEVSVYHVTSTSVIIRNQWGPNGSYSAGQSGNGIVTYPYYVFLQLFQGTYSMSPDPINIYQGPI